MSIEVLNLRLEELWAEWNTKSKKSNELWTENLKAFKKQKGMQAQFAINNNEKLKAALDKLTEELTPARVMIEVLDTRLNQIMDQIITIQVHKAFELNKEE